MIERSIKQLQADMADGTTTSKELVLCYLERIEQFDKGGPRINAIIEVNPDAVEIAASLDEERLSGTVKGPLHGIPVALKDNIDTADRMTTTAGSSALTGSFATTDADVVASLRESGAVLLAKANMSEWANFRSSNSISGWSSRGGQTRNPYDRSRSPSGSSSGSAAAVAANFCAFALGTEADGSVISPSHTCGVVGLKTTHGLIGTAGVIPIAPSFDTVGISARSVEDAAVALDVCVVGRQEYPGNVAQQLASGSLDGVRIGVSRNFFGLYPQVDAVMEQSLALLNKQGAILIDPANLRHSRKLVKPAYRVFLYEFYHSLNKYLSTLNSDLPVRSLGELVDFNRRNSSEIMPYFEQEHLEKAMEMASVGEEEYLALREEIRLISQDEGVDETLQKYELDAIVTPSGIPAWKIDQVLGDRFWGGVPSIATMAGYPTITVPAGFVSGLPIGISFIAGANSEPDLLNWANAFESACQARRAPDLG